MVATNEFEDAWLDEGINSYTEVKSSTHPRPRQLRLRPLLRQRRKRRAPAASNTSSAADFDPVTRWAFKFRNANSYGDITYGKSATVLATLEKVIGARHHETTPCAPTSCATASPIPRKKIF